LDPDPESGSAIRKNAGSGSALNQCGSETLPKGTEIYEENEEKVVKDFAGKMQRPPPPLFHVLLKLLLLLQLPLHLLLLQSQHLMLL
jgi:hypothetical protein